MKSLMETMEWMHEQLCAWLITVTHRQVKHLHREHVDCADVPHKTTIYHWRAYRGEEQGHWPTAWNVLGVAAHSRRSLKNRPHQCTLRPRLHPPHGPHSSPGSAVTKPDSCSNCKHMQPKKCKVILVCTCSLWNGPMVARWFVEAPSNPDFKLLHSQQLPQKQAFKSCFLFSFNIIKQASQQVHCDTRPPSVFPQKHTSSSQLQSWDENVWRWQRKYHRRCSVQHACTKCLLNDWSIDCFSLHSLDRPTHCKVQKSKQLRCNKGLEGINPNKTQTVNFSWDKDDRKLLKTNPHELKDAKASSLLSTATWVLFSRDMPGG